MSFDREQSRLELQEQGFTVIRGLHSTEEIKNLKSLLEAYYDASATFSGAPARDQKDKRIFNLASKNHAFIRFICKSVVLELLSDLQDVHYRWISQNLWNFIINSSSARSSGDFLDLHIDSGFPFLGNNPLGFVVINAIDSSSVLNGTTFLTPGSHHSGTFTDRSTNNIVHIALDPGDVAILDSRIWHGAGENTSGESRWTINTHYTRWFFKQDMDIPRTISQEIFEMCTEQEKILLGFCSIPSPGEHDRINIKCGVEFLKSQVKDHF